MVVRRGDLVQKVQEIVKFTARKAGVEIGHYRPRHEMRAQILRESGVDLVLDIGANQGQYGRELRRSGYASKIVSFEPLARPFAELSRQSENDPEWTCHRLALGDESSMVTINRSRNTWSSSLLSLHASHLRAAPDSAYVGTEQVEMRTLDSIDLPAGRSTLLKLDVQGYELHVLRGATRVLENVSLIECELSIVTLYEGSPLGRQMLNEIDGLGFDLVALEPGFRDPETGRHLQFEGTFARREQA